MIGHILIDVLRNSILITGLVIIMMIMIEFINVGTQGKWLGNLRNSRFKQIILASFLGIIPGCMGGFATVSLYSHRLISFGALVAMMIASSGDEAFVMLAMIPKDALILFAVLFVLSIIVGLLVDLIFKKDFKLKNTSCCGDQYAIHKEDKEHNNEHGYEHSHKNDHKNAWKIGKRTFDKKRSFIYMGMLIFILALLLGLLEHEHENEHHHPVGHHIHTEAEHIHTGDCNHEHSHDIHHEHHEYEGFDIFSERWMNILFGVLSLITMIFIFRASDHFVHEHLWDHVIKKHLLTIFLWTFGALLVIQIGLQYINIENWLQNNVITLIIIASLIGLIPESGPHLIFVTLFASGLAPFSVLLASSISQDGHAALPLLAESKSGFIKAKLIGFIVAIVVGIGCHLLFV